MYISLIYATHLILMCIHSYIHSNKSYRIMPIIREKKIFMLSIQLLQKVYSHLDDIQILLCCHSISMLTDTDDFDTYRNQYVSDVTDAEVLCNFKDTCMMCILSNSTNSNTTSSNTSGTNSSSNTTNNSVNNSINKKSVRPLIDCIDKAKRMFK